MKRLNNFLSSTELTNYIQRNESKNNPGDDDDHCIILDNCSFSWYNQDEQNNNNNNNNKNKKQQKHEKNDHQHDDDDKQNHSKPFLQKIQMKIKTKSFVAIVGAVGSGKSSLLQAILGNMELTNGTINMYGKNTHKHLGRGPTCKN